MIQLSRKSSSYWSKPAHVAYLFVAPVVLLLLIFRLMPTVAAFVCGFFDMNMFLKGRGFVGLENFVEAFSDARLWNSLLVTIKFALVEVPVQMVVGLVLAALLTRNTARKGSSVRCTSCPLSAPPRRWPSCGACSCTATWAS